MRNTLTSKVSDHLINDTKIAEFVGMIINEDQPIQYYHIPYQFETERLGVVEFTKENLKFHKSWEWLMAAVERIETMFIDGHQTYIITEYCYCSKTAKLGWDFNVDVLTQAFVATSIYDSKFEAYYMAVITFVDWYNENREKYKFTNN